MARIHATALVDPGARLAADVEVGAFSIVGPHVEIGDGTIIGPHVVITGRTTIGRRNRDLPVRVDRRNSAGPQVRRRADDDRHRRRQRRCANTCRSTRAPRRIVAITTIGNGNLLLAYTHVAHDCVIGNHTTFSNNAQIAGHVRDRRLGRAGGVLPACTSSSASARTR